MTDDLSFWVSLSLSLSLSLSRSLALSLSLSLILISPGKTKKLEMTNGINKNLCHPFFPVTVHSRPGTDKIICQLMQTLGL